MKKVLFATTALVASAGFAAADITLTGSANMGIKNEGSGDTYVFNEIDFNIVASGTSDNGLTFGASVDLDDTADDDDEDESEIGFGDAEVFVSGSFGTVTIGQVDVATDGMGLADAGFDGIGLDDDLDATRTRGSADVEWKYSAGDFGIVITTSLGLSSTDESNEGDFAIRLNYAANGFSGALGYAKDDSTGYDSTMVTLGYSANGLTGNFVYHDAEFFDGFGIHVAYDVSDALTIHVIGNDIDPTSGSDDSDFGVGFNYDLGGGLALAGAVGSVDDETVMDLGLTMKF